MRHKILLQLSLGGFVSLCLAGIVLAQSSIRMDIVAEAGKEAPPPRTTVVVKYRTINVPARPTTGILSVASEPTARLSLTRRSDGREIAAITIPAEERLGLFENLAPGRYLVQAQLAEHDSAQGEVEIKAGQVTTLTLDLPPRTYDVRLQTNLSAGEVWYIAADSARREMAIGAAEPYLARPLVNGQALLPRLRAGRYDLDIRPTDHSFLNFKGTIEVGSGKTTFPTIRLERRVSDKELLKVWTALDDWSLPTTWRSVNERLVTNGAGLALPRDEKFRRYDDLQLTSDVMMQDGKGVSFVVRAVDERNYYLVELTGPQADEPYVLRSFVVRDGEVQRLQASLPTEGLRDTLQRGKFFTVLLRVEGYEIKVSVINSATGETVPLGVLSDPSRHFRIGGVGLAARGDERTEFARFYVCPLAKCPPSQ
jgi:hypothetical protein